MSQEPTEKEISTSLEKLTITIDLQKKPGRAPKHLLYLSQRFYVSLTV